MGANKIPDRQKCGEILINIKTIKNKAKVFTFHCTLCSMDCDQLKKFSKHLEEHLHYFVNARGEQAKVPILLYEPEEIKVEEHLDMELIDKSDNKIVSGSKTSGVYEDPLETENYHKNQLNNDEDFMSRNIKNEAEDEGEVDNFENDSKIVLHSSVSIQDGVRIDEFKQKMKSSHDVILEYLSSNDYSESSSDADFDIKRKAKTTESVQESKNIITKRKSKISQKGRRSKQESNDVDPNTVLSKLNIKRRRRVIIETILPFLIQQYKKYKILWQVDDIAFGVKDKKYEIYAKIAEDLKLEANVVISLADLNYHINFLNELYSKDKEIELKCKMEKREFAPAFEPYKEMSFLSGSQGPFLCAICNQILPKYNPYCQHMADHNGTQPFKCPSCDMMFTNYHKYLTHKKRHLGIYDFRCDVCGKGYLTKNDLEWHVTSHTGDKPYLCQICGTGFRARHGYDNHIRRHEERFRHECHICKRGFNQLHALNSHVKSHLNIRDVICKICGKGFVHSKYLKRHELIHGKEKRYKCNECGKAFFQSCGLRAHRKNHHS